MKFWKRLHPPILAIGSVAVTFVNLAAGQLLTGFVEREHLAAQIIMPALIGLTIAAPPLSLLFLLTHYRASATSMHKIVMLYLSLILICATINLDIVIHAAPGEAPFSGIDPVWIGGAPGEANLTLSWPRLGKAFVDCLHFSVTTLSTVGYGDIAPRLWYAKLAVDLEILMGLGITVLTVGHYFSKSGAKSDVTPEPSDG